MPPLTGLGFYLGGGLAFYKDVAPTALGVDLGLAFYKDVAPLALGNITA